jgi:hypothetical protein
MPNNIYPSSLVLVHKRFDKWACITRQDLLARPRGVWVQPIEAIFTCSTVCDIGETNASASFSVMPNLYPPYPSTLSIRLESATPLGTSVKQRLSRGKRNHGRSIISHFQTNPLPITKARHLSASSLLAPDCNAFTACSQCCHCAFHSFLHCVL